MGTPAHFRLLAKQQLPLVQPVILQSGTGHCRASTALTRFAVAQIDPALLVLGQVEQSSLTGTGDGRQSLHRMALPLRVDAQQTACPFADQKLSARQQHQTPGMGKPLDQRDQGDGPDRRYQTEQHYQQPEHVGLLYSERSKYKFPDWVNIAEV